MKENEVILKIKVDSTEVDECIKKIQKLQEVRAVFMKQEKEPVILYLNTDRWVETAWKTFDDILSDNLHKTYYCWNDGEYWNLLVDYGDAVDHYKQKVKHEND